MLAGNRVFISSTCFDLIDVRAELEETLRVSGIVPVLSDSATSGFEVAPDADSIETCLVNVRACDLFVLVLSRRYGPSLKSVGFEDVSATHLEYREAVKLKKPIFVYVRDRLQASYDHWRKQKKREDFDSPWLLRQDNGLLRLIDEHNKLVAGGASNWLQTFKSSVDLKQTLLKDLRAERPDLLLRGLIERNAVPQLRVAFGGASGSVARLQLMNHGGTTAFRVTLVVIDSAGNEFHRWGTGMILKPDGIGECNVDFEGVLNSRGITAYLRYDLATGMVLDDVFDVAFKGVQPVFVFRGKRFFNQMDVVLTSNRDGPTRDDYASIGTSV